MNLAFVVNQLDEASKPDGWVWHIAVRFVESLYILGGGDLLSRIVPEG